MAALCSPSSRYHTLALTLIIVDVRDEWRTGKRHSCCHASIAHRPVAAPARWSSISDQSATKSRAVDCYLLLCRLQSVMDRRQMSFCWPRFERLEAVGGSADFRRPSATKMIVVGSPTIVIAIRTGCAAHIINDCWPVAR